MPRVRTSPSTRRVETPRQVALGRHRHQGPLRPPPRLQQPVRGVAAGAELGDGQVDGPHPGVPGPLPEAVAGVHRLRAPLALAGAAEGVDLGAHQGPGEARDHFPQQVGVSRLHLLAEPGQRVHAGCGHRHLLEVGDASSKDGGGLSLLGLSAPSHTTPLDANRHSYVAPAHLWSLASVASVDARRRSLLSASLEGIPSPLLGRDGDSRPLQSPTNGFDMGIAKLKRRPFQLVVASEPRDQSVGTSHAVQAVKRNRAVQLLDVSDCPVDELIRRLALQGQSPRMMSSRVWNRL